MALLKKLRICAGWLGCALALAVLSNPIHPAAFAQSAALSNAAKLGAIAVVTDPAYAGGTKGDGTTDDTAALQAAINTGKYLLIPPGTYRTTATLNFTANANVGQRFLGSGSTTNTGVGANAVVIKPSSAVSVAILIDGQGGNAIQGFEIGGFTVDMTNMTDASSSIAVRQVKAFNGKLTNIQTLNEGTNKRAFKFEAGAYTTIVENARGTIVQLAGNSLVDATTTLTFLNCDFDQYTVQYAASINVLGGALQGSLNKFVLADVNGFHASGIDIEGTGTAWSIGANVSNVRDVDNEWSGFSGTYKSGSAIGGIPVSRAAYGTFSETTAITYSVASPTPTIAFGGSSTGVTYANQGLLCARNNRVVTCTLDLSLTNNGSGTGSAVISGLPFAGNSSVTQDFAINLVNGTYTGDVFGRIGAGLSTIQVMVNNAGSEAAATELNVTDSATMRGTFSYQM